MHPTLFQVLLSSVITELFICLYIFYLVYSCYLCWQTDTCEKNERHSGWETKKVLVKSQFSYITLYRYLFNFLSLKHHSSNYLCWINHSRTRHDRREINNLNRTSLFTEKFKSRVNAWTVTFACSNNFKGTSFRRPDVWIFFFRFWPYVRKTNHSEGSRCVTETSTVKNSRRRKIIKSGGFWDDCGEL